MPGQEHPLKLDKAGPNEQLLIGLSQRQITRQAHPNLRLDALIGRRDHAGLFRKEGTSQAGTKRQNAGRSKAN